MPFVIFIAIFLLFVLLPGIAFYSFICIRRMMKLFFPAYRRGVKAACLVLTGAVTVAAICVFNVSAIVVLYTLAFFGAADILMLVVRLVFKLTGTKKSCAAKRLRQIWQSGLVPMTCAAAVLVYGAVNMATVRTTEYELQSGDVEQDYRVVLITDTHYGTIQNTDLLKKKAAEISASCPDIVILGGDIVEEGTSREEMTEVFGVLGDIKTKYGVFYIYGNHDRQFYSQNASYSVDELAATIEGCGITLLCDERAEINGELVILGRNDVSTPETERAPVSALLQSGDEEKFVITADHQPVEAEENAENGVDLVLSGHTHAGQLWPGGLYFKLTGAPCYGLYEYGDCRMIVSSGFTGWGYPIRTEKHCEYVEILISAN